VYGPWGNRGHLGSRGSRGTRPARRGKGQTVGIRQWRRVDIAKCLRTQETGSPQHQATFMHRVRIIVYCVSVYCINNHNRNSVLLYYLFQKNKSFGSKKPFAFILWCMRSCVEHRSSFRDVLAESFLSRHHLLIC
jgi:hypothetical protein